MLPPPMNANLRMLFIVRLSSLTSPAAEYRRADPHVSCAFGDGRFEIGAHPHRQCIELEALRVQLLEQIRSRENTARSVRASAAAAART